MAFQYVPTCVIAQGLPMQLSDDSSLGPILPTANGRSSERRLDMRVCRTPAHKLGSPDEIFVNDG